MASGAPPTTEPAWLAERRRKGASLASELALPTPKEKGWEFTDLTGLDLGSYAPGEGRVEGIDPEVDGADGPPVVLPLRQAAERLGDVVEQRFGSVVPIDDPFVARNEANWRSGVFVYVPRGQRLQEPLRLSVHQDKRDVFIAMERPDKAMNAIGFQTPLSIQESLDVLVPALAKATAS